MTIFSRIAEDFILETTACFGKMARAPSYTSRVIQAHLEEAAPEFIKKDEWPPQSPDFNPMDYAICIRDFLKEKVYRGVQGKFPEQALMNRIIISWKEISIEEICKSIFVWKKQLRLVVEEDVGHIEHRLK